MSAQITAFRLWSRYIIPANSQIVPRPVVGDPPKFACRRLRVRIPSAASPEVRFQSGLPRFWAYFEVGGLCRPMDTGNRAGYGCGSSQPEGAKMGERESGEASGS